MIKERKVISIIKQLTVNELLEFRRFLKEVQLENRNAVKIFDVLLKSVKNSNQKKTENLKLENIPAFPDKLSNAAFHKTYKIIEKYFVLNYFKNSEIEKELILMRVFFNKKINNLFKIKTNTVNRLLNILPHNENTYNSRFLYNVFINNYYQFENRKIAIKNINTLLDSCIKFFLMELLQIYIYNETEGNLFNKIYYNKKSKPDFLNEIILYIENHRNEYKKNDPVIYLYFLMLKLALTNDEKIFNELLSYTGVIFNRKYDVNTQNSLYNYISNYCTHQHSNCEKELHFRQMR